MLIGASLIGVGGAAAIAASNDSRHNEAAPPTAGVNNPPVVAPPESSPGGSAGGGFGPATPGSGNSVSPVRIHSEDEECLNDESPTPISPFG
jgi:hypothetical protein